MCVTDQQINKFQPIHLQIDDIGRPPRGRYNPLIENSRAMGTISAAAAFHLAKQKLLFDRSSR
jgi:hypothetical protein